MIGAGISGLTVAYELARRGAQVRIFEKSTNVGGLARTEIVDGVHFDSGPHLFHSNNTKIIEYWKDLLGNAISTPSLFGANYIEGKVYEYPLSKDSIESQFSKEEVDEIYKDLNSRDLSQLTSAASYAEYVRILAGRFLSEKFFKKYPEKLWGISTNDLSAKFAPRRVEIRESSRAFHSGEGKWAAVLKGGCGTLARAIEQRLNNLGIYVEYSSRFTNFEINDQSSKTIHAINFNSGKVDVSNGIVISTVPITKIAESFNIKTSLWYRSLKIICILVDNEIQFPNNYDWLYFDSEDTIFHRVTLQNSFSIDGIPKNHTILSCEIAYSENDSMANEADNLLIARCISDLKKTHILRDDSKVIKSHLIDAGFVYPGIDIGYEAELNKVSAKIDTIDNLYRHGALAEFEYADLQILTAKSIDLAETLLDKDLINLGLVKKMHTKPSKEIYINGRLVGNKFPPFIIAEAGLNHNGSLDIAMKLIHEAKNAGVDAIKFQTYKQGRISKKARTSGYYEDLIDTQESLSDYLDKIILPKEKLAKLFDYAKEIGITLFSTPFDLDSLNLLESLACPLYKISSMDIVNLPLIREVAKTKKPIIISTGMSNLADIEEACNQVLNENNPNLILLHCVSSYPCPSNIANLKKISNLSSVFKTVTGYSDHTTGLDIAIAACSLGAAVLEKHFTLDRKLDGPDHNFSLIPNELNQLVVSAKRVFEATQDLGFGIDNSEINTALNLRRSIFYDKNIKKGHKIQLSDLTIKSPGIGLHPRYLDQIIGSSINCDVIADTPVIFSHFLDKNK